MSTEHEWIREQHDLAQARWARLGKWALDAGISERGVALIWARGQLAASTLVKVLREGSV
jgi:hypothetical protein